jgi:alpha-L-rhamnosidase
LWNGDTANPAMNSGNHVMLVGDLAIWLYEDLAGIKADPEQPGFKHIIMQPTPVGDLKFVRATHLSPYGWISSEWHWEGGQFDWQIKIPANTTATVYLPVQNVEAVTESGRPLAGANGVKFLRVEDGRVVVDVQSGAYHFVCKDTK